MNIEFFCTDTNIAKYWPPKPIQDCIPDRFLNLADAKEKYKINEETIGNIKACLPAMDYMSSGYVLFNGYELEIAHFNKNFRDDLKIKTAETIKEEEHESDIHARKAMAIYFENACPVGDEVRKQQCYFKIKTAWGIKTPPGYSCLIVQPFYSADDRLTVLPAIVDTDTYHLPIPVVGYLNEKTTIRVTPGTPLLHIIPFKRDEWTMSVNTKILPDKSKFYIWNSYKRLFHTIKKYL